MTFEILRRFRSGVNVDVVSRTDQQIEVDPAGPIDYTEKEKQHFTAIRIVRRPPEAAHAIRTWYYFSIQINVGNIFSYKYAWSKNSYFGSCTAANRGPFWFKFLAHVPRKYGYLAKITVLNRLLGFEEAKDENQMKLFKEKSVQIHDNLVLRY